MKRVYKYEIEALDITIQMPAEAQILHVAEQHGTMQLWAQIDPDRPLYPRRFRTYGTGHDMPDNPGKFAGTMLVQDGNYVFHVYEVAP